MKDQLMIHKPKGVAISSSLLAKIRKEYTCANLFYMYNHDKKWWYSDTPKGIDKEPELFSSDSDSVIIFQKYQYGQSNNPVSYIEHSADNWLLASCVGVFPYLTGINDKCPEILFENFLKYLDQHSITPFINNVCEKSEVNYATIVNGTNIKRYGKWKELDGLFFNCLDFYDKMDYQAKTSVKNILAFLIDPDNFAKEVKRLDALSDYDLRLECENYPSVKKILESL